MGWADAYPPGSSDATASSSHQDTLTCVVTALGTGKSVQSVERAAAILNLLASRGRPLGLVEVARGVGLAKATAHGLLRTLCGVGFVEQDKATSKYALGSELLHLGSGSLDVNELRSRSINWADTLAASSGEAVRLGVLLSEGVRVVHHVFRPDDSIQSLDVGSLLPAHATAMGKALLAYDSELHHRISDAELDSYTRRTITDRKVLVLHLADVRERGWALEIGEMSYGQASVAAPIREVGGLIVGAVGICGSQERVCPNGTTPPARLVSLVQDTASAITRELGTPRR